MKNVINYFIKHRIVTNWVMLAVMLAGVFALFNLERRLAPKLEIEEVSIQVPYPGASAVEVEEGITIKIEEALRGIEGIQNVSSVSSDGFASLDVELIPDYDMNKALQSIRNAVNSINSYPTGAENPVVFQETQWNRAVMLSIYGPEDLFTLKRIVEDFRDDLLATGAISEVRWWGLPNREISIEVSPENLRRYRLTIEDISRAVRNSNLNISSGSVLTDQEEILIRSYNRKYEAPEFERIEVVSSIDGTRIRLADIATVREQWPENMFYAEYNGRPSVGFNVMYNNNEDVIEITRITEDLAAEYEARYAGLVNFDTFIKDTDELEERLSLMTTNGLLGLLLVLGLLGLFLNVRLSFWVALGIPFSLLGMFFVLWLLDITINEMSLFGIIMVIGILVDDGIIIGESIYSQYEKYGKRPIQAAIDGTMDVIKPVTISVVTTMIAFIPYFYFYGMLGKYVWQIAAVIIIALAFSLIEAFIILPAHLSHSKALQDRPEAHKFLSSVREKVNGALEGLVNRVYSPVLRFALDNRWAVTAGMIAIIMVIAGMFQGQHVRAQFFPSIEPPYARMQVEVPAGTSAEVADRIRTDLIQQAVTFGDEWDYPGKGEGSAIKNYTSWMGGNTINIFFVLPSAAVREFTVGEFSDALAEYIGEVPAAENVIVGGFSFGGTPISVRFQSSDYEQLLKAKELLKDELRGIAGVKDIRDDTPLGNNEFVVDLKPKGQALGFTVRDLTTQLRQGFYGDEVMRLQKGRDEVKVWVRFPKEDRVSIAQIENLKVRTPTGEYVPFKEVADYHIERGLRRIRHDDGRRSVTVYADLDYSQNDLNVVLAEVNGEVVPSVLSRVDGVSRAVGSGQQEEVSKMVDSMTYTMTLAFVAMFTILLFLLKSPIQTLIILGLIPLGVIGAVIGHFIVGIPVSILSFLGIVALAGIIINDSVVLVDRYNKMIAKGKDVGESLYEAAMSRFRPIVLTTVTTCGGLAPIILMRSEQGQFLVPMAVSVAFGLLFGTFLTLLLLPSTLYLISDLRVLLRRKKSRTELEPAYSGD
ncbi:MAG: efflux RND transporter permease subunit [Gemmatimonadetes bacterium]|uniref:Efflux RND transporter permease subunit n=1 Tax=Candidatus Kutchimonas denitrificans TaxID=3056748 RepID=A0AAE5CBY2_9BACT|nr:efflux RND transporter permease subunit [Gemmatimonadota bacterium]NIR73544.1 efflux RND transporter permease subunit [Candidatus Kutchimonas denitrificans]NIR99503.1 efflux RND transporter permease subunit [Gemmatimonadota bacterium]NIT65123.1 efflux RND transporter permease subunit [Gemmatimonadota bacterium]NIV23656.1 MMPL family transporter [Gemmatimonadota bacterium]